jgi:hypothetical protein
MTPARATSTAPTGPTSQASSTGAPDAWQATRAQTAIATQFVQDKEEYLATEARDIGRQTGSNERELFVSCAPAEAMQQQFDHLRSDFIAVHDIATHSSRKLLAGVAAATGRGVQKLAIRRQGYGTPLATLEFIELATADGGLLRMYTTDADSDSASRRDLARTLLANSRLGVVMVGDLAPHAIDTAFKPLNEDMLAGVWPNRHLLLLPLAAAAQVANRGVELTRGTGVVVRTTPLVTRPADAWGFIQGTWSRLRELTRSAGASIPALASFTDTRPTATSAPSPQQPAAPVTHSADSRPVPLAMRPMPVVPTAATRAGVAPNLMALYLQRLSDLSGMVSCCIFEVAHRRVIAHAGASPGAADLAAHGADLLGLIGATSRTLGLGHAPPEAAITLGAHHLLLRAVPKHPGLALHAVLDKTQANLTLVRLQVLRLDALFDEPPAAQR